MERRDRGGRREKDKGILCVLCELCVHTLWLVAAIVTAGPASAQAPPSTPPPIAIVGARLIDGTGAAPVDDAVVVVDRDRIRAAGTRAQVPVMRAGQWVK